MHNAHQLDKESPLGWTDRSAYALDFNGPVSRPFDAFPDEAKGRPIIELLQAVVCRYPERIALKDSEISITYSALWRTVAGCAEQIAAATAPGDLVGIVAPVSAVSPIGMLACLAAGRPFVAIDPRHPAEWIRRVVDDSRPALLLGAHADLRGIGSLRAAVRTFDLNQIQQPVSLAWRPADFGPDVAACVLFTSGSTGQPKGIVNSQRNLLQRVSQSINSAHVSSDDRFLTLTSLCTIVGVRDVITGLLAGAAVHLLDAQTAGAREVLRIIQDERISILFAFPALLRSIVQSSQTGAGDHLRLVRIGGDTTLCRDIAMLRKWMTPGTFIQLIYAATEAPMMQWFVGDLALNVIGAEETEYEDRMPIGYPIEGNALAIVDENGAPTPEGDVGELLVRSPYVALGAWPRGQREATNVQTDPGDQSLRILHTGDLVRRRSDGLYDRIGRKDRQVKVRGTRVELDGVEAVLRRHNCVRDVAVLARLGGANGAVRLVAYVQLDDASGEGLSDVEAMMRRIVPSHMQPARYYALPTIPRLLSSKLDGGALRAIDLAKCEEESEVCVDMRDAAGMEEDPVAALVARIWRRVLAVERIAAEDDFFHLGGDSLGAITMTVELEEALGRELPMTLLNQAPTFGAFCAQLQAGARAVYSPLVVLKAGHRLPALFLVHGVGGSVTELFALARKMSWSGPVIGIQARGLDRRDVPHSTVVEMADEYLRAMKVRQPHGPYLLGGYSFGGLVAFELARRLSDSGDEVAFVGLIDTLPPKHHFLRLWKWAGYLYRRLTKDAKARSRGIQLSALRAAVAYRPKPYCGELTFLEPARRDLGVPSAAKHWAHFAHSLQRHTLAGRHDDMLNGGNAIGVAAVLTQCLEAAIEGRSLPALPGRMSVPDRSNISAPVKENSDRGGATATS